MPKDQKSKIPQSSGGSAQSPVWSVTRRQRTELSPRRDDETGTTQSFSSRTVTTTERVQMIPVPVNSDIPMDVLTPRGRSERSCETTIVTSESHSLPIIGGVAADGALLCTGLHVVPKTTEMKEVRTTMTTTTTTTYSLIEIGDSEEELQVETEERTVPGSTQITLDFPLDYKAFDFKDIMPECAAEEKERLYVVVGKKDSPTRTTDTADYVVKMIDVDLPPRKSKEVKDVKRISGGERRKHDYDAFEGTIASTSRTVGPDERPIQRYMTVHNNGVSSGESDLEDERISKEISTVVAKLSGAYKRASIAGEHTVYRDTKAEKTIQHDTHSTSYQVESPRRLKSTYVVRFSDPFRIEADDGSWILQQKESETVFKKAKKDHKVLSDDARRKEKRRKIKRKDKTEEAGEKKPTITTKIITGLFKRDDLYREYPTAATFEGPVDATYLTVDTETQPIEQLVTVYHSGRSDEPVLGEEKRPAPDVSYTFGANLTNIFKRTTYAGYPKSSPYNGPLTPLCPASDVQEKPLQEHVSVYHSGRSDETLTDHFKTGRSRMDYPTSAPYDGPFPSTSLASEMEEKPLQVRVSIYHGGRPDETVTDYFKRGRTHMDYPASGSHDGLLASTSLASDLEEEPLQHHVTVYHSGRSDEPDIDHTKGGAPLDYPASGVYKGPLDLTSFASDMEEKPLQAHVSVYYVEPSHEPLTDHSQRRRGRLYYLASPPYSGPLASTKPSFDMEEKPLHEYVSVYHSGRSDEQVTRVVEMPTEIPVE
ncbi:unnamed protein product, partial [Litomosoides sigmodontis]